jgi:hypothetical protein
MKKIEFFTVMNAEQYPDCYGGKNFDEHEPMWKMYAEGDKDSVHQTEDIILDPKLFPAGTKVIVQEPICPKCDTPASCCIASENCSFDWKEWADIEFA